MTSPFTLYCPAHIEFLLHCRLSPAPHPFFDAPVYRRLVPELLALGVIEPCQAANTWKTTALGNAWIEALCRVPLPRAVYIDERGRNLCPP